VRQGRSGAWELALAALLGSGCYSGLGTGGGPAGGDDDGAGDADDDDDDDDDDGSDAGDDDGEPADPEPPGTCDGEASVAPRPMVRLSPVQLRNTLRDLVGDPEFEPNYAVELPIIDQLGVRQLRDDAEQLWARRDQWSSSVFECDPTGAADDDCISTFIDEFVPRAFRRPPTDWERDWLYGVYEDALVDGFENATLVLFQTVLQAPATVYREEVGEPVEGAPAEIRRLTDYELASRLSYFLWDSMPDDELLAAASADSLSTTEEIEAQVVRMLQDPRAVEGVQRELWHWLELDGGMVHHGLYDAEKDTMLFPEYSPALQDAMHEEFRALVADVLAKDDGDLTTLLTDNRAYVNASLAQLYGVDGPATDDDWMWVELDPEQRGGVLTRAAFLTVYAGMQAQGPIVRGVSVLEDVMCQHLGDPPPDADDDAPAPVDGEDGPMTTRELTDFMTAEPACQACHSVINPMGYAFEHYDAIGRWQDDEVVSGLPVDASGEIRTGDSTGVVYGAVELSERLSQSPEVRRCFAERWMKRALSGPLGQADTCERDRIADAFVDNPTVTSLLGAIATSEPFRLINTAQEQ